MILARPPGAGLRRRSDREKTRLWPPAMLGVIAPASVRSAALADGHFPPGWLPARPGEARRFSRRGESWPGTLRKRLTAVNRGLPCPTSRRSYGVEVVDEDDGLARVRAASSSAELHRLLITGHLCARSADYREAAGLLRQFHADDVRGMADTAVLLMLSARWHPHTAKMIADLVASGILTDEALDEVAQRLLWSDRPTWTHPSSWFGLEVAVRPVQDTPPKHESRPPGENGPARSAWCRTALGRDSSAPPRFDRRRLRRRTMRGALGLRRRRGGCRDRRGHRPPARARVGPSHRARSGCRQQQHPAAHAPGAACPGGV